jgi:folate-binding protein YgfZ
VWFGGSDAIRFLNDLISQEIAALAPGSVVRSFLLQPRGKIDHLLWALRDEDRVGLVTESDRGPDLVATLSRYRIRVDVEIGDPEPAWMIIGGNNSTPGKWQVEGSRITADLPWGGPRMALMTGSKPNLPEIGDSEFDRIRIESGEPRYGVDIDESTIPQESGLVPDTVSFTKGCFLGQELVARIDSRGHVNKRLRVVEFNSESVAAGAEIHSSGKPVGVVTSVAGNLGLAMVRSEILAGASIVVGGIDSRIRD